MTTTYTRHRINKNHLHMSAHSSTQLYMVVAAAVQAQAWWRVSTSCAWERQALAWRRAERGRTYWLVQEARIKLWVWENEMNSLYGARTPHAAAPIVSAFLSTVPGKPVIKGGITPHWLWDIELIREIHGLQNRRKLAFPITYITLFYHVYRFLFHAGFEVGVVIWDYYNRLR